MNQERGAARSADAEKEKLISSRWLAFKRGLRMYNDEYACPQKPEDDDDMSDVFWAWCGWRIGLLNEWRRAEAVAEALGDAPDDLMERILKRRRKPLLAKPSPQGLSPDTSEDPNAQ